MLLILGPPHPTCIRLWDSVCMKQIMKYRNINCVKLGLFILDIETTTIKNYSVPHLSTADKFPSTSVY